MIAKQTVFGGGAQTIFNILFREDTKCIFGPVRIWNLDMKTIVWLLTEHV